MTWFTARPSVGITAVGRSASGARRSGVHRCAEPPILGFAGLKSANRSVVGAFNGLIAAPNVGTIMGQKPNRESRLKVISNFGQVVKGGALKIHPLVTRLVDREVLEKMGAERLGEVSDKGAD